MFVQLLDSLPHTVRGVGRELTGSQDPAPPVAPLRDEGSSQGRKRDRIIGLVGYIVVVGPHSDLHMVVIHWQKGDAYDYQTQGTASMP